MPTGMGCLAPDGSGRQKAPPDACSSSSPMKARGPDPTLPSNELIHRVAQSPRRRAPRRGDKSCDYLPGGLFVVRSLGPTAVSASSISRLGLCLDLGNGASSSAASDDCPLG